MKTINKIGLIGFLLGAFVLIASCNIVCAVHISESEYDAHGLTDEKWIDGSYYYPEDYGADAIKDCRSEKYEEPTKVEVKSEQVKVDKKVVGTKKVSFTFKTPMVSSAKQVQKDLKKYLKKHAITQNSKEKNTVEFIKSCDSAKITVKVKKICTKTKTEKIYKTKAVKTTKVVKWNTIGQYWNKAVKLVKQGYTYSHNVYKGKTTYTHFTKTTYKKTTSYSKIPVYKYKVKVTIKYSKWVPSNQKVNVKVAYLYN